MHRIYIKKSYCLHELFTPSAVFSNFPLPPPTCPPSPSPRSMVRGYLVQILVEKILTVNSATRCPVSATALSQYPPLPFPVVCCLWGGGGRGGGGGTPSAQGVVMHFFTASLDVFQSINARGRVELRFLGAAHLLVKANQNLFNYQI